MEAFYVLHKNGLQQLCSTAWQLVVHRSSCNEGKATCSSATHFILSNKRAHSPWWHFWERTFRIRSTAYNCRRFLTRPIFPFSLSINSFLTGHFLYWSICVHVVERVIYVNSVSWEELCVWKPDVFSAMRLHFYLHIISIESERVYCVPQEAKYVRSRIVQECPFRWSTLQRAFGFSIPTD